MDMSTKLTEFSLSFLQVYTIGLANGYSYKGEYLRSVITLNVSTEASYRNT